MRCGRTLEFVGFDRPVLVRRGARGPEFDACGVRLPRRYSRVGVPCFRVLVSRVRDVDVATDVLGSGFVFWFRESGQAHSRSLLKKKWSDARAARNFLKPRASRGKRVNKTEDSHSVTAILISTKTLP